MIEISSDLLWWITVIDMPALGGLLIMIWRTRIDMNKSIDQVQSNLERRSEQLRDALSSFKLEVAKNYASHKDLRSLETRLVEHLLRIEAKLDSTALKAASLEKK